MTTFSINPEFDCPASELTEQVLIKWFSPIMNSDSIAGENWLIRSFAHVKFLAEPEQTEELFRLFDATKVVFRCNPNLRQLSQQADDATVAAMAAIERFYWQKHGEFFNAIITHYVVTAEDYEREVRQPLEHACQSINVFCKAFCEVCKKTLARKFDAKVWEIYPGRLSAEDLLPVVERRTLSPDGVASLWFEQVLDQQSAFKAAFQPDAEELDFIRTEQIIEDDQGRPCYSNEPFDSIASHRLLQKSFLDARYTIRKLVDRTPKGSLSTYAEGLSNLFMLDVVPAELGELKAQPAWKLLEQVFKNPYRFFTLAGFKLFVFDLGRNIRFNPTVKEAVWYTLDSLKRTHPTVFTGELLAKYDA